MPVETAVDAWFGPLNPLTNENMNPEPKDATILQRKEHIRTDLPIDGERKSETQKGKQEERVPEKHGQNQHTGTGENVYIIMSKCS